ncbi:MAG: zf-HC2 domain-containing protein [bacterium]|nr:zf-HC2 domain-containing protein [bacterium]
MTHAEIYARLPAYAAGELDPEVTEVIRNHLAGGCDGCLREVFALPREPVLRPASVPHRRPRLGTALAVGAALVAAGVLTAWRLHAARIKDAEARVAASDLLSRELAALRSDQTTLSDALARIERTLDRTDADAAATRERAELIGRLAGVEDRVAGLARQGEVLAELVATPRARQPVDELLTAPGARVHALVPAPPGRDGRGYAVWAPLRPVLLVHGFGLPPLPAGETYRVRVRIDDDTTVSVPKVALDGDGRLAAVVMLPEVENEEVTDVELVSDPGGRVVLTSRPES